MAWPWKGMTTEKHLQWQILGQILRLLAESRSRITFRVDTAIRRGTALESRTSFLRGPWGCFVCLGTGITKHVPMSGALMPQGFGLSMCGCSPYPSTPSRCRNLSRAYFWNLNRASTNAGHVFLQLPVSVANHGINYQFPCPAQVKRRSSCLAV